MSEPENKALVLHSGGIDSTTCLYLAIKDFGADNVQAISIDYGQRHLKEIAQARVICRIAKCAHGSMAVTRPPISMLTDPTAPIPDVTYDDIQGVSPTYVPFRNGLLLSTIAGLAHARGASFIYFGAHSEDAQNWAYPDCTPEFIGAMANAIYIGTYHQVRLHTPLQWLTKKEVIWLGNQLGVPFKETWSCYAGEAVHCGKCPTCYARQKGFKDAGIIDSTVYVTGDTT